MLCVSYIGWYDQVMYDVIRSLELDATCVNVDEIVLRYWKYQIAISTTYEVMGDDVSVAKIALG